MEQSGWVLLLGVVIILIIVLDGKWRVSKHVRRSFHKPLEPEQLVDSPVSDTAAALAGVGQQYHGAHFCPCTPQVEPHVVTGMTLVGPSIRIAGEIFAEESLVIMGAVSGAIKVKRHGVMIAEPGTVADTIEAPTIIVDGSVTGRLQADEKVELLSNARFSGTIAAERVSCEAGARLQGEIIDYR
ncbi:bactofilin family protein [Litchfieldella anticariensis]|nr:polymer-forming cytoskeletal protein [Halomonas anticariensis]